MIEASHVSKCFGDIRAVDDVSLQIRENRVFGLIGTNGAGKSTMLRMLTGVYRQDAGEIHIDGREVFENPAAKGLFFYISDEQYFPQGCTPQSLGAV